MDSTAYAGFGNSFWTMPFDTPLTASPRKPKSPRSPKRNIGVKYHTVQEQLDFASVKYDEVLSKYMNTPCCNITPKMEEDVWAWGIFSETVLPMLTFIDEEQ